MKKKKPRIKVLRIISRLNIGGPSIHVINLNKGLDKNLSPYAFTKAKNLELLENLKRWFNFKYEVIDFDNVYGPYQISKGQMSTVIGIFEDHYKKKKSLPVVKPGTQTRRFTHIDDTIQVCFIAWKKNLCRHYSIANKKSYSLIGHIQKK